MRFDRVNSKSAGLRWIFRRRLEVWWTGCEFAFECRNGADI